MTTPPPRLTVPSFSQEPLDKQAASRLAGAFATIQLRQGETVAAEGSAVDRCYLVEYGSIEVRTQQNRPRGDLIDVGPIRGHFESSPTCTVWPSHYTFCGPLPLDLSSMAGNAYTRRACLDIEYRAASFLLTTAAQFSLLLCQNTYAFSSP